MSKRAIVLGLGISGLSLSRFLLKKGFCVFATDNRVPFQSDIFDALVRMYPERISFIMPENLQKMIKEESFEFLATSPGVPPTNPIIVEANKRQIEIVVDIELGLRELKNSTTELIGITGSNGKTTVVSLLSAILKENGMLTKEVGNIGNPFLDELEHKYEKLVVELSSFQLTSMSTPVFSKGAILNIYPNHLDYHKTFSDYSNAKIRLADCLKEDGTLYLHNNLKKELEGKIKGKKTLYFGSKESDLYSDGENIIRYGRKESLVPLKLRGLFTHDLDNFLIAYGLARDCGVDPEIILKTFEIFKKPPHRIEFIRNFKGVEFYDDSKGTNLEAVIKAVDSVPGNVHLIAGGVHKGAPYTPWTTHFPGKVISVYAIGDAAGLIEQDLKGVIPVKIFKTLEDAILNASNLAKPGESVLLSPGCSSYDMFKDYKERGLKFQEIVNQLKV